MHLAILLSDEFSNFSSSVSVNHERKKDLIANFQELYKQHKADLKAIDDEVLTLQEEFEAWQAEKLAALNAKKKDEKNVGE